MRNASFILLLFLGSWSGVFALRSGKYCFEGCLYTLNCVDFNDTSPALSKNIRTCQSALRAKSLYLCIETYCTDGGRTEWLQGNNETCQSMLPPYDTIADYAPGDVVSLRRLQAEEGMCGGSPVELGEVVLPEEHFFERAFRTLEAAFFEIDIHWLYGMTMYYFWGAVVSIGLCTRLASLIRGTQRQEWLPVPESESSLGRHNGTKDYGILSLPYALMKRYIITPATFGYRCSQNVRWCTIPPRIQSITIASFVLLNIVLCSISYDVFEDNIFWPRLSTQMWRYISDRTGIISLANFPIIWLFGTRNNTLMWLTGWGFGAYNNFHRWVARVATVQAVVHSIGYTEMVLERGGWALLENNLHENYFWNGEWATIFMCALCAFSVYGLRRSHYEIFLVTHIIFSIIVLVTMYYHVEIFNGEWNIFIWPCLLIWLLDRTLRGLRILAFNPRFWNTKCTATYDSDSNLVRLEVPCSQSLLKPKPGTYYYIYVLNNLLFAHQSHPFTLAYIASNNDDTNTRTSAETVSPLHNASRRPSPHRTASDASTESETLLPSSSHISYSSLVFLVRPYDGFTSRLKTMAISAPKSLRVLIEGPYGETIPLHTFSNVLFIVGGTGIAVMLSHLEQLLNEESGILSLRVVWAVREHAFLIDVMERFKALLGDERVELVVHVTRDEECKDSDDVLTSGINGVRLEAGRPDVYAAVEEAAGESGHQSLAVVACGPAQMADDARKATVLALENGHRRVEYFEESFKW